MRIVNQNKDEIVNFDNIMNICMTDCDEDGYGIYAGFIVGRDDNYRELGIYKTKERAKEVLKELLEQTTVNNYIKEECESKKDMDYFKLSVILNNLYYEMPKE